MHTDWSPAVDDFTFLFYSVYKIRVFDIGPLKKAPHRHYHEKRELSICHAEHGKKLTSSHGAKETSDVHLPSAPHLSE